MVKLDLEELLSYCRENGGFMGNNELGYSIKQRYSHELLEIKNELDALRNNLIYELTNIPQDGSLATNVKKLEKMFADLLDKIQNDKDSDEEQFAKYIK